MIYLALLIASVELQQTVEEPTPRGNPADWIDYRELPSNLVHQAKHDTVVFKIAVNPSGTPIDCEIMQTSGSKDLDKEICIHLMSNSRFQPARDSQENPVSGEWTSRIRFATSPSIAPDRPGLSYESEFEYRVDKSGKAIECRSIQAINVAPVNCADALGKRVITPPNSAFTGGTVTIHTTRTFTPET